MKCQFCGQELPAGAKFCSKCSKQVICRECGEKLVIDSVICVFCGIEVNARTQMKGMNHIKYSESESGKSFEASFSDETAGNVVETFARFMPLNKTTFIPHKSLGSSTTEEIETVEIKEDVNDEDLSANIKGSSILANIDKVFTIKGESILLSEKRLKSKSMQDYQARIALLFLLYKKYNKENEIKRSELNAVLKNEGLYDSSFRAWFSCHKSLFLIVDENKTLELSPEGEEQAHKILSDVFDNSIEGTWHPQKGVSTNKNTSKTSNGKLAKIVTDLNLMPQNANPLNAFMDQYNFGKSNPKIILLFVYYMTHILKINSVNQDHVFTCYRHMKISIPNNLYQCLVDTISKKGWIENISNLSVTAPGINEVEHNLKK